MISLQVLGIFKRSWIISVQLTALIDCFPLIIHSFMYLNGEICSVEFTCQHLCSYQMLGHIVWPFNRLDWRAGLLQEVSCNTFRLLYLSNCLIFESCISMLPIFSIHWFVNRSFIIFGVSQFTGWMCWTEHYWTHIFFLVFASPTHTIYVVFKGYSESDMITTGSDALIVFFIFLFFVELEFTAPNSPPKFFVKM